MESLFALTDRVAVVTGGSRGIGEMVARTFAAAGASVVIAGRQKAPLEAVAVSIRESGGSALAVAAHCGRPEEIEHLMAAAVGAFGAVDILVNNAATSPHLGPILEADDGAWAKTLEINTMGYVRAARAAAARMTERSGGKIVNVSSIAAERPLPGLGVYGASKAAVTALTRSLAAEVAASNIQVNAIAPGLIRTHFSRALWADAKRARAIEARIPAGRFGEVDDLAGAFLFLASSASDYTTGAVLTVDGGYSLV